MESVERREDGSYRPSIHAEGAGIRDGWGEHPLSNHGYGRPDSDYVRTEK